MKEHSPYYFPSKLDEPFRIYTLTMDEFFILVTPILCLGFIFEHIALGFIVGIGCFTWLKKFKGEQGHFYLIHLIYWHFPRLIRLKITPPSCIRLYIG